MKEHKTIAGKIYTVTSPNGCTVTDETGLQLGTVEAGEQKVFTATGGALWIDDTAARVTVNFNKAAAKLQLLGLFGGGAKTGLPSGYLAAEFLESTGTQYVNTNLPIKDSHIQVKVQAAKRNGTTICGLYENFGSYRDLYIKLVQNNNDTVGVEAKARNKSAYRYNLPIGTAFDAEVDLLQNYANVKDYSSGKSYKINIANESYIYSDKPAWFVCAKNVVSSNVATGNANDKFVGRLLNFKVGYNEQLSADFVPSVNETGKPCLYDKITKKPFYNSGTGSFIVGMTLEQARKLGKLPAGGGTLTVSLPSNYLEDDGVTSAIAAANKKGWNITVASTWDATGTSATFALRRIWVRKTLDEQGNYIDADGVRWQVESCVAMYNADGSEPDSHGYEPFRSVESATEYWGLQPYIDPNAEQELLTDTENE